MSDAIIKDGYARRLFDDCACFTPLLVYQDRNATAWSYDVVRLAFVPAYHVVRWDEPEDSFDDPDMTVLSSHKTLAEALSICKVLLANGGVCYA